MLQDYKNRIAELENKTAPLNGAEYTELLDKRYMVYIIEVGEMPPLHNGMGKGRCGWN